MSKLGWISGGMFFRIVGLGNGGSIEVLLVGVCGGPCLLLGRELSLSRDFGDESGR